MLKRSTKCVVRKRIYFVASSQALLKKEFKVKLNSVTIHNQYKRKQQQFESSRQYIYAMQEIAEQGYVEEDALV